jgi:DNA-binding CsgD family transcriptional regulator
MLLVVMLCLAHENPDRLDAACPSGCVPHLTKAERAVAERISQGLSYKDTARALGIAPATVRNQLHVVYAKLGVKGKVALSRRVGMGHSGFWPHERSE